MNEVDDSLLLQLLLLLLLQLIQLIQAPPPVRGLGGASPADTSPLSNLGL